ncbi:MAG: acetate/propionate family kinase [Myxococcales bacterium]|nr:acetate/propionate family kinase [Myxococcales bacterium]
MANTWVLVINCGSSSIKLDVLDPTSGERATRDGVRLNGKVERVGKAGCRFVQGSHELDLDSADHTDALQRVLPTFLEGVRVAAVGHRVVHGGARFDSAVRIDESVEQAIEELAKLAPLHNPPNLAGIRAARRLLADLPHVAVFDTAFHGTLPTRAREYALPAKLREEHGIRRYGFHGPSHRWVASSAAAHLNSDLRDLRLITCHLGNGASVCAVEYGRSIDTSMGMTPLEGLVMGTRSGDVDPGVLLELLRQGKSVDGLDDLLNRQSGLAGLSGVGNDLRDIEARAAEGDEACRLALQVFTHRLRKYIGAYAAVLGGVDAIVFTGGIGENSALIRHRTLQRLEFLGARLDEDRNRDAALTPEAPVAEIHEAHSRTRLLVVATDEARAIAQDAAHLAKLDDQVERGLSIPIAISARHIHLTDDAVTTLFGEGHRLTPRKDLSQPGQYACEETLTVVGPKGRLERVRVLGPTRGKNQVEVSRTDEFKLGVDAPVRDSGDTKDSPGVTLIGPEGSLTLDSGLICARRHIHMTPADAERFGVRNKDVVEVAIDSDGRDLVFGDVLIRVSDKYRLEMHIDTDEGNAAEITPGMGAAMLPDNETFQDGMLIPTKGTARLRRRSTRFD